MKNSYIIYFFLYFYLKVENEWTKVDHAVLLVGWGEELGQKYWLVSDLYDFPKISDN